PSTCRHSPHARRWRKWSAPSCRTCAKPPPASKTSSSWNRTRPIPPGKMRPASCRVACAVIVPCERHPHLVRQRSLEAAAHRAPRPVGLVAVGRLIGKREQRVHERAAGCDQRLHEGIFATVSGAMCFGAFHGRENTAPPMTERRHEKGNVGAVWRRLF